LSSKADHIFMMLPLDFIWHEISQKALTFFDFGTFLLRKKQSNLWIVSLFDL